MSYCMDARVERARQSRRGLTLIELIVVLIILVGLGGLLVPVIGNALTRTHVATCAQNFDEVFVMLQNAQARTGNLGNGWTNPAAATPAPGGALDFAGQTGTLTDDQIEGLAELGMVDFTSIDTGVTDYNVTFNNGVLPVGAVGSNAAALTDATTVVVLTADDATGLYLPPAGPNQQYVFFGLDKSWSLLGTLTTEPPVHFGDNPAALPDAVYSRFGAVFLVDSGDATPDNGNGSARLATVTVHIDGAFETGDNHAAVYWSDVDEN